MIDIIIISYFVAGFIASIYILLWKLRRDGAMNILEILVMIYMLTLFGWFTLIAALIAWVYYLKIEISIENIERFIKKV